MDELGAVTARVAGSTTLAGLLDASFDAFEAIRQVARGCEDRAPELFAAFVVAAGTATEGRNALNDAPSLPGVYGDQALAPIVNMAADVGHVADELAGLAALLAQRLAEAAALADLAGNREACQRATRAAADIYQLLGRDTDATAPG
jgi:hypothetical protein